MIILRVDHDNNKGGIPTFLLRGFSCTDINLAVYLLY